MIKLRARSAFFAAALVAGGMMLSSTVATAADILVMGTQALRTVHDELVPDFERATKHKVSAAWVGSSDIVKRIREGEVVDIVLLASGSIDELTRQGKLVAGSRVDVARSGVGVAVRGGAPPPDIGSEDAFRRMLLAARSIAISSGSSSVYLTGLFRRMGIAEAIAPRLRQMAPGIAVGEVVARGEAEIGFQQVSELLPIPGITFVGPLPPEIQTYTTYSGAIHVAARVPGAARELLRMFTGPAAPAAIAKAGMVPLEAR